MWLAVAVLATALVVGAVVALVTRRVTRNSFADAAGVAPGEGSATDVRRRLNDAETRTAAAEARTALLQLSLDALTTGVIITDRQGQVITRNTLASETTAKAHEQSLVDAAVTELVSAAITGEHVEREVQLYGPPPRTLFVHAVPIAKGGELVGSLAVIDDVTDHHRIEKVRRDFVANLSHELRTPVGAASLLGEMLVDEPDADTRKNLTERLMVETDRMTATIDDLLELSRIESADETYDEVVSLQQLIEEALARNRVVAENSNVQLGSVVPADALSVTGNRSQLLAALVNLVENAVKYSSSGDTVSVRSRLEGDVVHLVVQDTGRGIPARDRDRIFERFYRVDRSRDSTTGGTGIGLSIVRHVAINHGGAIEVDSFEGEGSTFTLTLPYTRTSNVELPAKREAR